MALTFEEFRFRYLSLRDQMRAGKLPRDAFVHQVNQLTAVDRTGMAWRVSYDGEHLLKFSGGQWYVDDSSLAVAAGAGTNPAHWPAAQQIGAAGSGFAQAGQRLMMDPRVKARLNAKPLLAFIPSALVGALWFLYTFIGVFKNEGWKGVDFITPLIMLLVPILFWVLYKPIGYLLAPLRPLVRKIPKPMRYGILLAVPFVLGLVLSKQSNRGYEALRSSVLLSSIIAGFFGRLMEAEK